MPEGSPNLVWRRNCHEQPVLGVILAAGLSRRFGDRVKLDAKLGERPLLRRICDAARDSSLDAVVAILGANAVLLRGHCDAAGIPTVINSSFAEGQSSSVRKGIAITPKDATGVMFLAADQPLLGASEIDHVLEAARGSDKVIRAVAGSTNQSQRTMGTPVVFPRRFFLALERLSGDQGGRQVLRSLDQNEILEVPLPEETLWDVDSVKDLERLKQHLAR